jgi:hypothetical protein
VKKVMYVVVMLIVLLLPALGWAQERSGNETVPEYNLWLPVVVMAEPCPYEATGPAYWYGTFHGNDWGPMLGVNLVDEWELQEQGVDLSRLDAEILVANDMEMKDILGALEASRSEIYGAIASYAPFVEVGKIYYAKARVVCIEYPDGEYTKFYSSSWTQVVSFVVTRPW